MNKLFGLFLLALAFCAPVSANAASRFLTCTVTCTITAADTSIWGTASGGTGASVPTTTDDVILDAATCVGGVTCTATFGAGYNPTWLSLTQSLCTASTAGCILDANPNNNTITLTSAGAYTNTGAGTRTLSGGTWVLSNLSAFWNTNSSATLTNNPSISFTSTSGVHRLTGGGKTYGTVSAAAGANILINNSNTVGTLAISPGNTVILTQGTTQTVTTATAAGSSSAQTLFTNSDPNTAAVTLSLTNTFACDWCGFANITRAGAGSITATNSFDFKGNNTGGSFTITPPSAGGGGRIIGG